MFFNYKKEVMIIIDLKIYCMRLRIYYFKIMGVFVLFFILRKIILFIFLVVLDRIFLVWIVFVFKFLGIVFEVVFLNRWLCDINIMGFI